MRNPYLVAITLAILCGSNGGCSPEPEFSEHARFQPIPIRIPESPDSIPHQDVTLRGLEAYSRGQFGEASAALTRARETNPGSAEVLIFLGSSLFLLGQEDPTHLENAREALHAATRAAQTTDERHEATWQLANVELARDNGNEAIQLLRQVQAENGPRSPAAAELLQELGQS